MSGKILMRAASVVALGCGLALCGSAFSTAASAKAQIVTFDPAGSIGTYPWQTSEDGSIVGFWYDSTEQVTKGFIRAPDGTITSFDPAIFSCIVRDSRGLDSS